MNRYYNLLKQEPLLRRLSLIQLLAYFGAWFSNVAIYTLLIYLDVDALVIAFVAALHFLPGVLQAPISGVVLDRIHPKKLMIILTIIEIITTLWLISIESVSMLWLLYILVFIRMGASSFHFTVEMSLLPRFLESKSLQMANEIHSVIWSLSYTVGMALGGIVVYWVGIKMAFLLDAMLFVVVLFLAMGINIELDFNSKKQKMVTMMKDALVYISKNRVIAHLMILHAVIGFTAFDALVALAAKNYYAQIIAVSLAIGLVNTARAVGLVIGPVVLGNWVNNDRLGLLFIACAISIFVWAYVIDDFYLSLIASVGVGFMTTTLWSYTYTLLQHHTDNDYYGRVVAYNDMLFLGVGAFVSIMIGILAKALFSASFIASSIGVVFIFVAIYYSWVKRNYTLKEIG